jgi:predicted MFS family arabinose efflux permease
MSHSGISTRLTGLLAVTAGVTVANNYYNQALLPKIALTFHASSSAVAWIAVATQLGYASGLFLLVPLGDSVNRKTLLLTTSLGAMVALLLVAVSVNLGMAIAASYLLGLICVTPQVSVPYGAGLADAASRGRVIGTIMSGLLVGILIARSLAGFLGEYLGWRLVFAVGAGFTLAISLCLTFLPSAPVADPIPYRRVLGSLWPLLRREPVLRRHALLGALSFGAFSAFWTTLAFYLASRPERYGGHMVGLIALIGVAGVAVAPIVGRLSDRFGPQVVNGIALASMAIAFGLLALSPLSLAWLAAGTFLMDAGAQGNHISNQTRIYMLGNALRSRVTSVYMIIYFLGGTAGAVLGSMAWQQVGWTGVCVTAATLPSLGLLVLLRRPGQSPSDERRESS